MPSSPESDTPVPETWPPELPPDFYRALEQLQHGDYYVCHETLEALWIPETRSVRELYQGVLQIAVGCYHLTARENWVGAVNKLDAGARRLERALPPATRPAPTAADGTSLPGSQYGIYEVDWHGLISAADRLQAHLRQLGRDDVALFDRALLPTVAWHSPYDFLDGSEQCL